VSEKGSKKEGKETNSGKDAKSEVAQTTKLVEELIFSDNTYVNMAIYAILEVPQELYFGKLSEKNINLLETVTLSIDIDEGGNIVRGEIKKPYFSPTKQRGVERRAIAYSLVKTSDDINVKYVPYYKYFNLSIDVTNTYQTGVPNPRDILTYLWGATWTTPTAYLRGRIHYGGGVAIQSLLERKQRNRVEYNIYNMLKIEGEESTKKTTEDREGMTGGEGKEFEVAQMIWTKEYVEPYTLIPIVRVGTLLGISNMEPHAMAYAFLQGLNIAGAGTPKGMNILEDPWLKLNNKCKEKVLVVDVGTHLLDEPVVIPPAIPSPSDAINEFKKKALTSQNIISESDPDKVFDEVKSGKHVCIRLIGDTAYKFLKVLSDKFVNEYLMKIDNLDIPRVKLYNKIIMSSQSI